MSDKEWQPRLSDDDTNPTGPPTVRRYHIRRALFSLHYDVTADTGELLFHVDVAGFRPSKPTLNFHHGPSTASPLVGVCYLSKARREHKFGLGDPDQPRGMTWETIRRIDLHGWKYHWSTDLLAALPDKPWEKTRLLSWKRPSTVKQDGPKKRSIWRRLYLHDEETGEVLAAFEPAPGAKIQGALEMKVDAGRNFDLMVLMTRIAMCERTR